MALRHRILLLGAVTLAVLITIQSIHLFPLPKTDSLSADSPVFSGVLRLWICEEASAAPSGLSAWLNAESARFEKANDGIYVQVTPVSRKTLSSFSYAANLPPDMVVFTPGVLDNSSGLLPVKGCEEIRKELINYENGLCTPIAMSPSCWAVRSGGEAIPLSGKALLVEKSDAAGALHAMLSDASEAVIPPKRSGIDLGLPIPEEKADSFIIEKSGEIIPGPGSKVLENARSAFLKGEGDALFVSGKTLRHLINASFDFSLIAAGSLYIDNLSLFSITDTPNGEKLAACIRFFEHLLSKEAQLRLSQYGAFSVLSDIRLYTARQYYSDMEEILSVSQIIPSRAFDPIGKEQAPALLSDVFSGEKRAYDCFPLS